MTIAAITSDAGLLLIAGVALVATLMAIVRDTQARGHASPSHPSTI